MQRQMSAIDSYSEAIDIDQGSVSNNVGTSQQTSLNSLLSPMESRFSNNAVSSAEASIVNAIPHNVQSFSGWNSGESSSRSCMQNQAIDDEVKIEERWSSPLSAHAMTGPRSEGMGLEPTNILFPGRLNIGISGNQVRSVPLFLQGSSSNNVLPNSSPSTGYVGDGGSSSGAILGSNRFDSGGLQIERASSSSVSFDNVGTSSGSSGHLTEESDGGSGSSLGGWGLSCKRKSLEGSSSSGNSSPGGSSSCFPQADSGTWLAGSAHHNVSGSLSLSTASRSSIANSPEQSNPRIGFGVRELASETFPSSNVSGYTDSLRNFNRRVNPGHQHESVALNLSTTAGARRSNAWSLHQSPRPIPFSDSLDLRSTSATNSNANQRQPHGMHTFSSSRNTQPCPWNGSLDVRAGNPSSSLLPGERGATLQEEANLRSIPRSSTEHPNLVPPTEMRNLAQDQSGWSLVTGNISTSGHVPSTRFGPSSSANHFTTSSWIAHHNPAIQNEQRYSEFAPWSLFPSNSEPVGHSGHFPLLSSFSSASSQETGMSSGCSQGHNQPLTRSAFSVEGQGDDVLGMPHSLRALAADIEGRRSLISEIRQVLNAMRRGENLRVEDYILFDPLIYHGMAEMHDRHRDMRLDVDNMSYEELLALEERIGDVSTGLSEATILKLMKQQKYVSVGSESTADVEPCCICQEEYVEGDDLGLLDCGHDFHTKCVKQWLMQKNLCPICKMTALPP